MAVFSKGGLHGDVRGGGGGGNPGVWGGFSVSESASGKTVSTRNIAPLSPGLIKTK